MKSLSMKQPEYQSKSGNLSTRMAVISFIIGTFLMVIGRVCPEDQVFILGYFYVVIATIVNTAMLGMLLFHLLMESGYRKYYGIKILILLANIPIAVLYLFIVFDFKNVL